MEFKLTNKLQIIDTKIKNDNYPLRKSSIKTLSIGFD